MWGDALLCSSQSIEGNVGWVAFFARAPGDAALKRAGPQTSAQLGNAELAGTRLNEAVGAFGVRRQRRSSSYSMMMPTSKKSCVLSSSGGGTERGGKGRAEPTGSTTGRCGGAADKQAVRLRHE